MQKRKCTCGAEAHVRRVVRLMADGREEVLYQMACPVCGQTGQAVAATGKDEAIASAEAVQAWNEMIGRLRPLEAWSLRRADA